MPTQIESESACEEKKFLVGLCIAFVSQARVFVLQRAFAINFISLVTDADHGNDARHPCHIRV